MVSAQPPPYSRSWEDLCPLPGYHPAPHFSETEKGLALCIWFITHLCRAIAFSQVLANLMGNLCRQAKYLEIRRHALLSNKSSFSEGHVGVRLVG